MAIEVGQVIEGKITSITNFGAFVALPGSKSGMIHISEVSDTFVKDINTFLKMGQEVRVKVCSIDEKGRIALSLKQVGNNIPKKEQQRTDVQTPVTDVVVEKEDSSQSFEDMMSRFMKTSNDKLSDLRKAMDAKRSSPGFSRKNNKKY